MFFFHLRRYDGALERDEFGLELEEADLPREVDAGARGLLIECIAEATTLPYRRFEIVDESDRLVLTYDIAGALAGIQCTCDVSPETSQERRLIDQAA